MDESTQKVVFSLVSVIVGWFLGQGTNLIQKGWNNRRLKKALLVELEDIKNRLLILEKGYARCLQIYALNGVSFDVSIKLNHPIYTKYYTDIFFKLNHSQRNSYEYIHGLIDSINSLIDKEAQAATDFYKDKSGESLEQWGELIKAQYQNTRTLYWHINYHIHLNENPEYGDIRSEFHREFLKAQQKAFDDMNDYVEKAKTFNREDFEKIYNEKHFEDLPIKN